MRSVVFTQDRELVAWRSCRFAHLELLLRSVGLIERRCSGVVAGIDYVLPFENRGVGGRRHSASSRMVRFTPIHLSRPFLRECSTLRSQYYEAHGSGPAATI